MRWASISATAQARACSWIRDGKFRAAFGGKFFRVIETNNASLGIENDRGGNDWAEERAAAGLIETGDAHPAKLSRRSLETGRAESVHCAEILARARAGQD